MPIYEYACQSCQARIEIKQKFSDDPLTICEKCGGSLSKLISAPAIMFKGSGWYVTDYSDKMKPSAGESSSNGSPSTTSDSSSSSDKTSKEPSSAPAPSTAAPSSPASTPSASNSSSSYNSSSTSPTSTASPSTKPA